MAVIAAIAIMTSVLVAATPAQAYIYDPAINGRKFASTAVCVDGSAINGQYWRVAYIAQQWNLKAGTDVLKLDYEDDCAAAGYPPSRRMVIGTFSNVSEQGCIYLVNQQTSKYNGFDRWTNGPGAYINLAHIDCNNGQNSRDHWVSLAIGWHLGLLAHDSAGWNSRVMNQTDWSIYNVPLPTAAEGQKVREIYLGVFCDQGTVC